MKDPLTNIYWLEKDTCRHCSGRLFAAEEDNIEDWGAEWHLVGPDDYLWVTCELCNATDWLWALKEVTDADTETSDN